jgi:hypothetical protein
MKKTNNLPKNASCQTAVSCDLKTKIMITEKDYLEAKKIVDTYESKQLNKPVVTRQVCTIGGECKVRGENNECKGTAYCGYKKHTFL